MKQPYILLTCMNKWHAVALLCSLLFTAKTYSQPTLRYDQVITGLDKPVAITNAGDGSGRLFIVQQTGAIRILQGTTLLATPFLDISDSIKVDPTVGVEVGLLNIVFDPVYETNGMFWVYYADKEDSDITITRFHVSGTDPNVADKSSGKIVLKIEKKDASHYGSGMFFGADGYLYISTGDSGGFNDPDQVAQKGNSLLGKMLRISVSLGNTEPYYTAPPDNPFATDPSMLPEIWDVGLRNPWRWSFDKQTHDMWLADVGQFTKEEVNFVPFNASKGLNFGWVCYEGTRDNGAAGYHCPTNITYTGPTFDYDHADPAGGNVITGGYVYRGTEFPDLIGCYIATDYGSGNVFTIKPNGSGGWDTHVQLALSKKIASFGEAEDGTLYAIYLAQGDGRIYKVASTNVALPVTLVNFSAAEDKAEVTLNWSTSFEQDLSRFEVEYNDDNTSFRKAGVVAAAGSANGATYHYEHKPTRDGKILYRLKIVDRNGSSRYSETVPVNVTVDGNSIVLPTVIYNGLVTIYNNHSFTAMELTTVEGTVLMKQRIGQGRTEIRLPFVAAGTYIIRLQGANDVFTQRVIIPK